MADREKLATDGADVQDQIKIIREDVAELASIMRALGGEKLEDVSSTLKKSMHDANLKIRSKTATIEDFITEKPVQSAFIALLVGVFIGSMSRR
jgi:ElaB/YqjD/DUF883 family membrane-anchored ribosome-binding protein